MRGGSIVSGFHRPSIVGMARSIGWLSMYVGLDFVHRRGTALAAAAATRLAAIPGVTVLTPRARDGDPGDLPDRRLVGHGRPRRARVAGLRDRPNDRRLDALRISVGFFSSEDELERFAAAVELLAAHTPETLPPRRVLTILGEG